MLEFVNQITDKPEWERKVFDEAIVARWKAEGAVNVDGLNGDVYLSDQMFEYVRTLPTQPQYPDLIFLLLMASLGDDLTD